MPIEVLTFAHRATREHLARLGTAKLRLRDGLPVDSDAGNVLYDLVVPPIEDPAALDHALRAIPGVLETGLFVRRADSSSSSATMLHSWLSRAGKTATTAQWRVP